MEIRKATEADLPEVERVFASAREFMRQAGNPTQWGGSYPERDILLGDLSRDALYVAVEDGRIWGVFAYPLGDDPNYGRIDDGAWLDDESYGAMHRVASDGTGHGLFEAALAFCRAIEPNVRIDTHADNAPMLRAIERAGFVRCGTVYHTDGTPRIAFQLPRERR